MIWTWTGGILPITHHFALSRRDTAFSFFPFSWTLDIGYWGMGNCTQGFGLAGDTRWKTQRGVIMIKASVHA